MRSLALLALFFPLGLFAQEMTPRLYDMGSPSFTDLWVDPVAGDDSRDGSSRALALASLNEAWIRIPQGTPLTTGVRIRIASGVLDQPRLPNYMESRYGTFAAPILIEAADGAGTVNIREPLNIFDCHYLYLKDLDIGHEHGNGDMIHFESCSHVLVKNCTVQADRNAAQETMKVNQTQYIYIEGCDIHGAQDNAVDFVAVQYGHVVDNDIHDAQDWCMYAKGGSAYLRIESNRLYNGGTGGFSAGQGTGFEFMTSPWLHYEAYHLAIVNNLVFDCEGAAFGVQGGYNILLAHNTAYRIGQRSHVFEAVAGLRSCDGDPVRCGAHNAAGGWGPSAPGVEALIPNRNVYVYNNVFYNPPGFQSQWQHFAIFPPASPPANTNLPEPVTFDTNLRLQGNIIWNGPADHPLGIEDSGACADSNLTCNAAQLRSDNAINVLQPQFTNVASQDFTPLAAGNLTSYATSNWPTFSGGDLPTSPSAPQGRLAIAVTRDFTGATRSGQATVGAYQVNATCSECTPTYTHVLYLPHFTFVNNAWSTLLTLVNPTTETQHARITAYGNDGTQVGSWEQSLAAADGWSQSVASFSPQPSAQAGWMSIETTAADVTGLMKFTFLETGGTSSLPLTATGGRRLVLPLLESTASLVAGLAIANLTTSTANVLLTLDDIEGSARLTRSLQLGSRQKLVSVLATQFPGESLPAKGFLTIDSDQDLTGFALSFNSTNTVIVAVPATVQ